MCDSIENQIKSTSRKTDRPFTIIVEGNIGSGKTTFLKHFEKDENVCTLAEPIELWRNCNGFNLLGLMYEDPKKWSFSFQSYVQLTMLYLHNKPTDCQIKLIERSIYSARYCFVEKMQRDGILADVSVAVINEHFKWLNENSKVNVDLIVYLRTSPETVFERMTKRNRNEEKSVSYDYLKALHDIHEDWLFHKVLHHCPAPVLVLDANLDKSSIKQEYEKCDSYITNRLSQLRAQS